MKNEMTYEDLLSFHAEEQFALESSPFKDFKPETANKFLGLANELCLDEVDAMAHFAACLVGLSPSVEYTQMLVIFMQEAKKICNEEMENEQKDESL